MNAKFAVLDGSSLFFRAFYALQLPPNARGVHTNAIHGFIMMLVKLLKELKPTHIVIAFDKSRTTFRTELYPDYKGTRDKTPEELLAQIPLLHEFAHAAGIAFIERDAYEADDIIGTLAVQAAAEGVDTVVVTGDRDALQLIRPQLSVLLTKKGISDMQCYDAAGFEEEYGFPPIRLIDMKGLMGDSSDNIPGVPGVGPKTATKLLLTYGSIENVLAHAEEVRGRKLSEALALYKEQALLSKQLATIACDVPQLRFAPEDFVMQPDAPALDAFCQAYELRSAWRSLSGYLKLSQEAERAQSVEQSLFAEEDAPRPAAPDLFAAVLDVQRDLQALAQAERIAVSGVFVGKAPFVHLESLALVFADADTGAEERRIVRSDASCFAQVLACVEARAVTLWGAKRYRQAGLFAHTDIFDLELADYLLSPEESRRTIERTAFVCLAHGEVPSAPSAEEEHAVYEAVLAARLQAPMRDALVGAGLWALYTDVELPLVPVLAAMEQTGVYVNRTALARERDAADTHIEALAQEIYTCAGMQFNISSPKQLGEVLFEHLGLKAEKLKKTKTGYSTNAETLEALRGQHPVVALVLQYRMWSKLRSTYLEGIDMLIHPDTGRVHTSFNQTVTATGRLSSSDPNLQNIPVRTEEGRAVRALFEPGAGYDALLSADYSQIELRILAHMSGDETLIDAFCQGQDVHARTAAEVFGVPLDAVTSEQRRRAKAVNFGIVYGLSDFGLSRDLHIPRREAAGYIERYFERYHGVREFLDRLVAGARKSGFVTTLYGRRRALPALRSRNYMQRSNAERMAMNTPIQGTAADLIKMAMIRADAALRAAKLKSRILLQVHDELVLEVIDAETARVSEILRTAMGGAAELSVPLAVDIHSGRNWAEAK